MDTSNAPPDSQPSRTPKQGIGKQVPDSAPAVPTAILRQLTGHESGAGPQKLAKVAKPAVASAPVVPDAEDDGKTPNSDDMALKDTAPVGGEQLDDGLSDPETDRAVDEITTEDSDELLAAEDAKGEAEAHRRSGFGQKCKDFFYAWGHTKWARRCTILALVLIIVSVAAWPRARYAVLNAVGVRSSLSITALDNATNLPLKNVAVSVNGQQATTDINGVVKIQHLKLGPATLTVQRVAFATITRQVVIGWGGNSLGNFPLQSVGLRYTINVTDYLSGSPLANVEANSNGDEAISDKNGKIVLTVSNQDASAVPVAIILNGYRTEQLNLPAANTSITAVQLVTDRQDIFISKQSGKYDLYKIDVDGKNKQLLLAGTGNENDNISLVVSPDGNEAALVSTRDNVRDSDGFLLTTLTLIRIADGSTLTLDHAEQIQIVDWIDNHLVYDEATAGASAANPARYRLVSYDYTTNTRMQLASANQFNGILTDNGVVYYVVAATDPSMPPSFIKVRPDGTGHQTIYGQEVWSVFRTDYNTFALQTPSGWYSYSTQTGQLIKTVAPVSFVSRVYGDSADGRQSLWIDTRDGQGVLLAYNLKTGKDTTLQTQDGLTYPVRWLTNNAVIYSIASKTETADYVLSLTGGQPHKITDVTHTYGITQGD